MEARGRAARIDHDFGVLRTSSKLTEVLQP
jgi:hypothetical protein